MVGFPDAREWKTTPISVAVLWFSASQSRNSAGVSKNRVCTLVSIVHSARSRDNDRPEMPGPRDDSILRRLWTRMPFSREARYRRAAPRFVAADSRFRMHLRAELGRLGFNAQRAEHTALEEILNPRPGKREVWVNQGIIGYGTSGNIALTAATDADASEVVEVVRQFKEL